MPDRYIGHMVEGVGVRDRPANGPVYMTNSLDPRVGIYHPYI
jgi:hypothetical protein